MTFAVLLYQDESVWADATPDEQAQYYAEHAVFCEGVAGRGVTGLEGEALRSVATATTVRRSGQHVSVTDGPFAETAAHW